MDNVFQGCVSFCVHMVFNGVCEVLIPKSYHNDILAGFCEFSIKFSLSLWSKKRQEDKWQKSTD